MQFSGFSYNFKDSGALMLRFLMANVELLTDVEPIVKKTGIDLVLLRHLISFREVNNP